MLSIYQEYSNHLEEIFENSFDYIYLHDKNGKIIDVNNVILRNLGYSKKEILNMKVTDFLVEEVISDIINEIDETMRTGIVNKPKTYKVRKKNGDIVFVEANTIPLRRNGKLYAILGIGHDVSAYKKVEQNLVISEKKYRHLFNQSPFSISLFDSKGNLIDSNGIFAQKMSNHTGKDLRGKNFIEIASNFQNSKQIIQMFSERLKAIRQGEDNEPIEFYIVTMNGEKIWLYWQSSKLEIDNQSYIQVIIQDITDRKKAELNLKKSEEKYRLISENASDLIAMLNNQYEYEYINEPAYFNLLGYSKKDLIGKKVWDLVHPEDQKHLMNSRNISINSFQETEGFDKEEIRIRHKNGEYINIEYTSKVFLDNKGKPKVTVISRDISKRKKAEKILNTERDKFKAMLDGLTGAEIGIDIVDTKFNILFQNQFLKDRFGDIHGESCHKKYLNLEQPCEFCPMEIAIKSNRVAHIELTGIDGKIYEIISAPLPDPDGTIDKAIEVILDITERKQSEQKLKESEEKYRLLSENTDDLIVVYDKDLSVFYSNEETHSRILGYSQDKLKVLNFRTSLIHKDDLNQTGELFKEGFQKGKFKQQIRIRHRDGQYLWFETKGRTFIDKDGKTKMLAVSRDITDLKSTEEKLIESEKSFRVLYNNSTSGIAYHKFIYDENRNPTDYIITDVNPKYEEILQLEKEDVLNKRATEVYQVENAPYLDIYSEVADTGKAISFETYFAPLNRYFSVSIISPNREEFISVFDDISVRKNAEFKLKRQGEELSTLNKIITVGNESTSLQEFLVKAYDQVLDIVDFDRGGIYLYNSETNHNLLVHHKNVSPEFVAAVEDVDISEGLFSTVFDKNKPFYIENFSKFMENSEELGVYSAVIVPLRSKDEYVGSLNLGFPLHQDISQKELDLLIAAGKQMGIIIQKFESEKLLMESEEKFRTLFEKADEGIILADTETEQILTANNKICEMLGYPLQELKNLRFADIHPKESLHYIDEQFEQEIDEYSMVNDIPMKRKDGSVFYCNVNSSQIEISGQPYFLGFFSDVTNRREAEQKLKESEEKFRSIAEYSDAEISIIQDGVFKYINQKALDTVGYTNEEINKWKPNELFEKIIHPVQRELALRLTERIQSGEKDYQFHDEIQFLNKLGDIVWLDSYSRSITFQGRPALLNCSLNITNKKKAEEELKESEEKFRSITEQSFMGIIVLQDGVFKYFNERAANINGYSVEEISNWQPYEFSKLIHPDDQEFVMNQARKKQAGDTDIVNHYQYRIIKKNRDIIWVENFSKTINYQGKPADLVMTIDITDKIKSEQKIKESEKILKDFIYNATDSISIWDSNLNLIEMNEIAADPWNATKRVLTGMNMLEMAPSIKETTRYDKYKEVIKSGEPFSIDNVRIPPKTGERYFNIKSFKVGNGIGIIGSEITERIRFEQEIKESEEKFRTIAEQSFMGIVIIQDGKIKYMNKALGDMSQYQVEEMLNWSEKGIIKMIHPDDVDYILKRLLSNREGTMSQLSQNSFRIINRSGEIRWLEDYTSKIIYQGKVANLITVVDITDKKQAEQLIIEENKRLLELEELRKDLITRVSHELKTPMTSIYGTIQILLGIFREKLDKEALKYAKIGYRGCLRLKELIENLLDMSRLESKKFELNLQKTDLGLLVDDCVNDMSYLADTRKQTIEIDVPDKVEFEIDRLRFRQVITNIISNAIKNTPREGNIVINLNEEDEYVDIRVRDNGVGLTQKEKEILFEKFGKIERYGMDLDVDIEGCGLGLYISKEIAELHGGQILVESEGRNKGATFIVRLFKK